MTPIKVDSAITGSLFPDQAIDAKKFLEEYFGTEL